MIDPSEAVGSSPLAEPQQEDSTQLSDVWRVVVLNDPVNLMSYVTMVLERLFRMARSKAEAHMMEVHQRGRSVVWKGPRENAEGYVFQLQQWHLCAVIEKDEED